MSLSIRLAPGFVLCSLWVVFTRADFSGPFESCPLFDEEVLEAIKYEGPQYSILKAGGSFGSVLCNIEVFHSEDRHLEIKLANSGFYLLSSPVSKFYMYYDKTVADRFLDGDVYFAEIYHDANVTGRYHAYYSDHSYELWQFKHASENSQVLYVCGIYHNRKRMNVKNFISVLTHDRSITRGSAFSEEDLASWLDWEGVEEGERSWEDVLQDNIHCPRREDLGHTLTSDRKDHSGQEGGADTIVRKQ